MLGYIHSATKHLRPIVPLAVDFNEGCRREEVLLPHPTTKRCRYKTIYYTTSVTAVATESQWPNGSSRLNICVIIRCIMNTRIVEGHAEGRIRRIGNETHVVIMNHTLHTLCALPTMCMVSPAYAGTAHGARSALIIRPLRIMQNTESSRKG